MKREEILDTAKDLTTGDRDEQYGSAATSFGRIANLWEQVLGIEVRPEQVALCMVMVKVSRLVNQPVHEDSWIDMAGYAGLGGELATDA